MVSDHEGLSIMAVQVTSGGGEILSYLGGLGWVSNKQS